MPQDWNKLNAAQRATVAVEAYSCPDPQLEVNDNHPKQMVTVGHRSAKIDIPLVALIERLWQNEFETIACCQSTGGDNPLAYVGFLSAEYGATFFMEILTHYGIPFNQLAAEPILLLPFGAVKLRVLSVSFHPDQIQEVTNAINEMTA